MQCLLHICYCMYLMIRDGISERNLDILCIGAYAMDCCANTYKGPCCFFLSFGLSYSFVPIGSRIPPCDIICHLALCRRQHNVRRTQLCAHRSQLAVSVDYFLERWYLICSNDRVTVIVQTVTWSITASKRVLVHQCRHAFGFCIHQACVTDAEERHCWNFLLQLCNQSSTACDSRTTAN